MIPLIQPNPNILGVNGQRMENDETTPACRICAAPHVGVLTPCYLGLRGSYIFSPELGCEVFALDPSVAIEFFKLPNGQTAVVVDMNPKLRVTGAAHEDCVETASAKLEMTIDFNEEDDLDNDEYL